MSLYFDFSSYLGIATIVAGGIWAIDACFFKKERTQKNKELIERYQLNDVNPEKIEADDLDAKIAQLDLEPMSVEAAPRMSKLADYAKSFFPVLLIVFLLRAFIAEPFRIPSGSMRPNLVEGDFILVNKFSYGVKFPLTGTQLIPNNKPHRGDVMVFRNPKKTSENFIKRVVGVPGDKVKVKDKIVYINDEPVSLEYIETLYDTEQSKDPRRIKKYEVKHYKENLNSVPHSIYVSPYAEGDFEETVVPKGQYFMMGDNRDRSRDSREWGFVPEKLILGKAIFIWISFDTNNKVVRWNRIGAINDKES